MLSDRASVSCGRLGLSLVKVWPHSFLFFWLLPLLLYSHLMDSLEVISSQCSSWDPVLQAKLIHIIWGNKLLPDSSLFSLALHKIRPNNKNLNNDDNDAKDMQSLQTVIFAEDHLIILILLHISIGQAIVLFSLIIFFCHLGIEFPDA